MHPGAVDVARGVEVARRAIKDPEKIAGVLRSGASPDASAPTGHSGGRLEGSPRRSHRERAVEHRFGPYGGQYVPETLMPALAELEAAWLAARDDAGYRDELVRAAARLRRAPDAALPRAAPVGGGRPAGLAQARGPDPHRRAQDQQRARPGAAGQAHGQDADHRRDRRRPARRRHGDRLRAARPRVHRLHGHRGHAPPAPQRAAHGAARRARRAGRAPARARSRRPCRRRSATGSPTCAARTT